MPSLCLTLGMFGWYGPKKLCHGGQKSDVSLDIVSVGSKWSNKKTLRGDGGEWWPLYHQLLQPHNITCSIFFMTRFQLWCHFRPKDLQNSKWPWSGKKGATHLREAVKNYLADFFRKGVPPQPPTPLTENHFAKNPLAERGGAPPPP